MNPDLQSGGGAKDSEEFRHGDSISVRGDDAPAPQPTPGAAIQPSQPLIEPAAPTTSAQTIPLQPAAPAQPVVPPQPAYQPQVEPEETHFFRADGQAQLPTAPASLPIAPGSYADTPQLFDPTMQDNGDEVYWTASEFIAHEKSSQWYLYLGGISLLIVAVTALVTRDIFSVVVAVIVCGIFGYAAGRPPREMHYMVDDHGLTIGRRFYAYSNFRGFSIHEDGPLKNLNFVPLKRFMPGMSIYFDPADEQRIVEMLSRHLPVEAFHQDPIDRLMKRIRY